MFTMGDWNTVAAPEKSETRFFSQINTESGMSPTCLFQSTLVLGKISPISTFCAEDNVEQCITYVDQELTTLGFPSLYAASKNGDARKLHVVSVVNCIHELLQRHLRNLRSREDTETQVLKLSSDLEYLQSSNSRLKDQLEITRRENNALQERDRQLQCKNRSLLQLLKNEKEEVYVKEKTSQTWSCLAVRQIRRDVSQFKLTPSPLGFTFSQHNKTFISKYFSSINITPCNIRNI
ncbi:afadin- and alpha-actinin-binding protein B-like [Bombina bombina]|uniref:afadin- and alpha-actinin-binding protein B-like n=1 Tax=Bombina bombina TaxID=8345 RepID=UPI00235AA3BE|nr:afadin- and alpha-actinin-binding protein B-like [Bombina bombina]